MRLKGTRWDPFSGLIDFSCVFVLWDKYNLTLRIERPCVLTNGKWYHQWSLDVLDRDLWWGWFKPCYYVNQFFNFIFCVGNYVFHALGASYGIRTHRLPLKWYYYFHSYLAWLLCSEQLLTSRNSMDNILQPVIWADNSSDERIPHSNICHCRESTWFRFLNRRKN